MALQMQAGWLTSTIDPTTSDKQPTLVVRRGDHWLNTTDNSVWVCINAGAGTWKEVSNIDLLAGNVAFTGQVTTTDGVTSGTARRIGGGAFRQVAASTAITGTTETETNFDQNYSLPANTLKIGTRVRIRAQGIHTATTGVETHDILLKLGTTTLASKAGVDPANSDIFYFDFEVTCRTAGAGGTIVGAGHMATGAGGTAALAAVFLASTAFDTTAAAVIAVAIDRQAAAADADSARLDYLTVEVIG